MTSRLIEDKHTGNTYIKCDCGHKILRDGMFENECKCCSSLYNGVGQKLLTAEDLREDY